jgi:hypothetical protein
LFIVFYASDKIVIKLDKAKINYKKQRDDSFAVLIKTFDEKYITLEEKKNFKNLLIKLHCIVLQMFRKLK